MVRFRRIRNEENELKVGNFFVSVVTRLLPVCRSVGSTGTVAVSLTVVVGEETDLLLVRCREDVNYGRLTAELLARRC